MEHAQIADYLLRAARPDDQAQIYHLKAQSVRLMWKRFGDGMKFTSSRILRGTSKPSSASMSSKLAASLQGFYRHLFYANCNIKLSISSVRISLETARCGLGEEGAVGDRRGQAERAGQAAKILSISASKASSGVL